MRIALGVEYHGQHYFGWQAQPNVPTIQSHLEMALSRIANHPVKVICAGRTDAGVHAVGQVVHFDSDAMRDLHAWVQGTNRYLPPDIAVRWAQIVNADFHARFSALSRTYRYLIYHHSIRSALTLSQATWYPYSLNIYLMQQASQYFLGEHDFSSFRSAECQSHSPMRNVHFINMTQQQDFMMIEIRANAFLHHMVRNLVGVLIQVGRGRRPVEWANVVLKAKDRRQAVETAAPTGLYLYQVEYPLGYSFPTPYNLKLA